MILSRPPALFPSTPATANDTSSAQTNAYHDHDLSDNNDNNEGGYDLVGVLASLAVPTLSAWIVIITR